jgi:hypothetical protein
MPYTLKRASLMLPPSQAVHLFIGESRLDTVSCSSCCEIAPILSSVPQFLAVLPQFRNISINEFCQKIRCTEYTQKNGAVSLYAPLKPHYSFVYTLYFKRIYSQSDKMYNSTTLIAQFHCPTCFESLIWVHLQGLITQYSHQLVQLFT